MSSKYHASTGYYYSFGNNGIFNKTDKSSVGQYVRKKAGYKSDINSAAIEEITSAELHAAIKNSGK